MTVENQIQETIGANDVVLFMKGTKAMPNCGFSSKVVGIMNYLDIDYTTVNILDSDEMRQGLKDYSDWPTFPQLYVKGEFVGGCDIVVEMALSGELDDLFESNDVTYNKDAAGKLREANQ
ncbi:MAG: Grx4 family monothiol glutaredoxin [Aestuariivita sp.]|nr:Grx4 family monothiol glutaredoxin [Aestuariivita sp.]MCY4202092.1 Grx4 family monothiol glutaredoxin [Aestuariivita sp.]MCY4289598.1 Grx4 family monothiol glutaredoxin [Aestuariivita sp.]MCY4346205.1 Grx4 family monothiol glutaredoxin [Aestuariivita sp.]